MIGTHRATVIEDKHLRLPIPQLVVAALWRNLEPRNASAIHVGFGPSTSIGMWSRTLAWIMQTFVIDSTLSLYMLSKSKELCGRAANIDRYVRYVPGFLFCAWMVWSNIPGCLWLLGAKHAMNGDVKSHKSFEWTWEEQVILYGRQDSSHLVVSWYFMYFHVKMYNDFGSHSLASDRCFFLRSLVSYTWCLTLAWCNSWGWSTSIVRIGSPSGWGGQLDGKVWVRRSNSKTWRQWGRVKAIGYFLDL